MLAQLARDGAELRNAATDLDLPVPTCPGWSVRDAVLHTGEVYAHKATIVENDLFEPPDPWPPAWDIGDPTDWFDEQLHRVIEALRARDPATRVWTWYPPEQNVGFWVRRMMQETVIHRADVESASSRQPPIPDEVAVDGIDELIERMLCSDDPDFYEGTPPGRGERVAITAAVSAWTITLGPAVASFTRVAETDVDVAVEGDAGSLLLAVWNRLPYSAVTATGDEAALASLQALVAAATQ
ncbi:MAG: hypothetical protein QOJ03_128 [Frankiaceae bacterium]|nr:hypothetical protein [Frankiaceae bacterium]